MNAQSQTGIAIPMQCVPLTDRAQIEAYLRFNPELFVDSLGDLEDDLWPFTKWYGAIDAGKIQAICLVFSKYKVPVVHAISEPDNPALFELVAAIADQLPDFSEIHLGPAAGNALDAHYKFSGMVDHKKMALRDRSQLDTIDTSPAEQLGPADINAIHNLYDTVYRDATKKNVFDPTMLDVGPYFGIRDGNRLISVAGVHVYSPRYNVAAIANVATHPEHRGQGLAATVNARLCQELTPHVQHIGLNVAADNAPALAAYQRIGFKII